jgi:pyrimidine-specific ribonucleoside hydrolase
MDVVLDVDTGVDDALAILFAVRSPTLRLRAVSCVGGNAPAATVVLNTLRVLDAADAGDVPVARGMVRPLLEPPAPLPRGHGEDGLADLGLPGPYRRAVPGHAVEMLRDVVLGSPQPVTLVALARLTNVAVLLRMYPEVAANLASIVVMGGHAGPGRAPEFNVASDPEAAAIVFASGLPTLVYGLEVFGAVTVAPEQVAALAGAADPAQRLAGRLLRHQQARSGDGLARIGDAGAVAAAADRGLLRVQPCTVRVGLVGADRGRTEVLPVPGAAPGRPHRRHRTAAAGDRAAGTEFAVGIDAVRCRRSFLAAVTRKG